MNTADSSNQAILILDSDAALYIILAVSLALLLFTRFLIRGNQELEAKMRDNGQKTGISDVNFIYFINGAITASLFFGGIISTSSIGWLKVNIGGVISPESMLWVVVFFSVAMVPVLYKLLRYSIFGWRMEQLDAVQQVPPDEGDGPNGRDSPGGD